MVSNLRFTSNRCKKKKKKKKKSINGEKGIKSDRSNEDRKYCDDSRSLVAWRLCDLWSRCGERPEKRSSSPRIFFLFFVFEQFIRVELPSVGYGIICTIARAVSTVPRSNSYNLTADWYKRRAHIIDIIYLFLFTIAFVTSPHDPSSSLGIIV